MHTQALLPPSVFERVAARVDSIALRISAGRWAALKAGVLCWLISTFVASPSFFTMTWAGMTGESRAGDFLRLCANPLARDLYEPILCYRVTVPTVAWLLQLPPLAALLLPYLGHVAFLCLVYLALRRRVRETESLLITLITALTFAVTWSNCGQGFTDTTTHALAASLLLTTNPGWSMFAVCAGLLNDERMIMALPFVFLWHWPDADRARQQWRAGLRWLAATAGGLLAYIVVRHALAVGWIGPGIEMPREYDRMGKLAVGFEPKLGSWLLWGLNVFLGFRWAWWLIARRSLRLFSSGQTAFAVLYTGSLVVGCLASAIVADVARSIAFMFPALLLAAGERGHETAANRLLLWIASAMLLTPVIYVPAWGALHWQRPLLISLARLLAG